MTCVITNDAMLEIRMRNWSAVSLKIRCLQVTDCCAIENVQKISLTKVSFGHSNAKIVHKMANLMADYYF